MIGNKVVARYRDGRIVRGFTQDFLPNRPSFHLAPEEGPAAGKPVLILPKDSIFGTPLTAGRALQTVETERDRPGTLRVRLRLNDRRLAAGTYTLRVSAVDPWGRTRRHTRASTYANQISMPPPTCGPR